MSISSALSTALSGLRMAQTGLGLVSQNVASANVAGYTRKAQRPSTEVAGDRVVGVVTDNMRRSLDTLLQRQLRIEQAGGVYSNIRTGMMERLDRLYGPPGSATALDSIYSKFTTALQDLSTSPESPIARSNVLDKARLLATRMNGLSEDIQYMRQEAETGIANAVNQANNILSRLEDLNQQILANTTATREPVQLMDQRDAALDELSKLMDIRVTQTSDNSVTIYSSSGVLLFDRQAARLTFDERTSLQASSAYDPDPAIRSVGTIMIETPSGYSADLVAQNAFRGGTIGGYLSMRDDVLVEAQAALDELASAMALALSETTQSSTTVSSSGLDGRQINLASLQQGDSFTVTVTSGGIPRTVTIVRVDDASQLPISAQDVAGTTGEVYGVSFASMSSAATSIGSILGPGFTVSNPSGSLLNILDDGASNTTTVESLTGRITASTLNSGSVGLPLFIDSGRTPNLYRADMLGGPQKVGFAGRIALNSDLVADPSRLVNYNTGSTYDVGDATRPLALLERLTQNNLTFAPVSGFSETSSSGTTVSFLQRIVSMSAQKAESEKLLAEGQEVVVNGLQDRFDDSSKVNVDEEMARLIELQQTYQASARIMTSANEMIRELMNSLR